MLKKHKNALFEAIKKAGLNPELFQAREINNTKLWSLMMRARSIFIIVLKQSPLGFEVVEKNNNKFSCDFACFLGKHKQYPDIEFESVLHLFGMWINKEVKGYLEEINLPDLWSELETYKSFFNEVNITNEGTSDFAEAEKADIRNSIAKYKLLLEENFHPNPEQTEFINEQLDYLAAAVERLNRFDWRGLAISTLMSIAVNLSVDTEKGKLLFSLFQQALQTASKLLQ